MAQAKKSKRNSSRKSPYLWEFLYGLLEDEECKHVIEWTNKEERLFSINDTEELAKLWGTVKNRPKMDQFKLFRAMRTCYDRGLLKKIKGYHRVYKFLSIAYKMEGCGQKAELPNENTDKDMISTNTNDLFDCLKSSEVDVKKRQSSDDQSRSWKCFRPRVQSSSSFSSESSSSSMDDQRNDSYSISLMNDDDDITVNSLLDSVDYSKSVMTNHNRQNLIPPTDIDDITVNSLLDSADSRKYVTENFQALTDSS
ncbi:ETS-related transcription factor Elf-4-like [Xenia sp. Carnegie-2017]|uniref:ETS-related transcription factor Elf-4-like n=1 Tax=Xenia sp. Carnegie-2017 TaxID=2897299 RepID=UPI001F048DC2|nr:ETS-related transcription factor Elf-4-like [Xenia sp. Carnegie-2017]